MICGARLTDPARERLREFTHDRKVKGLVATIVFSPSDSAERAGALIFGRDLNFAKASLAVKQSRSPREIPLSIRW